MDPSSELKLLNVSSNPWNHLNFNDQKGIKHKMDEIRSLKNGTVLMQINNYEEKEMGKTTVFSKSFYTSENGFRIRLKMWFGIMFDVNHFQINIELMPGEFGRFLPPLIHFRATYSILDQSERSEQTDRVMVYEPAFGEDAKGILRDFSGWRFISQTEDKEFYLKKDKIFIKVVVEPLTSLFHNYFSNDGILVWNIDNYERTTQESIKGINYYIGSEYFYSSKSGYRMKAMIGCFDGYIYFHLLFLVGEFDSELPSYFNHTCKVSIINQKQSNSSQDLEIGLESLDADLVGEKKVRKEMSADSCHVLYVLKAKVEKEPYLINDKIVIRFVVKAL